VLTASCAGDSHETPRPSRAQDVRENVDGVLVDIAADALAGARESGVDLTGTVKSAIQRASGLLGDVRTDLTLVVDPERTIAGIGVGGYTDPNTGDVTISLDDAPGRRIATWLPVTVAYELDHVARVNHGPGFGSTLLEVMVTEGMADAFATQAYPAAPAHPWAEALSPQQLRTVWARAHPSLDELLDLHGYAKWFQGKGRLPPWTGYSIGSGIVSSYLARHPEELASDLVTVQARKVLRGSGWMAATGPPTGSS
jgi:Predicted Zn-dependent protease (DUF2268)